MPRFKETSRVLDQVLEKIIKEHEEAPRIQKDGQHEDFIDILLSLKHQHVDDERNHEFSRDHIKATLLEMISGAYETVGVTIEWTLSELLRNPRVMKNLQDELEIVVGMDRMVKETDLSKLNYLNVVVKESFRLHPVVPFIPRACTKDVIVDGYFIEKNSKILVNLWALGQNPKIWSDSANVFYPERFLSSNIDLQGYDFELIPFGSGRRKCPGMLMGLTMVKLIIAQLVHCFKWHLPYGMAPYDLDMTESFGFALSRSKQLLAVPIHRLSLKAYNEENSS